MLKFDWNGLHVGDKVLVHDPESEDLSLVRGVVAAIDARKGANRVGVRLMVGGDTRKMLWPTHLAVHVDPRRPTERCWRCDVAGAHTDTDDSLAGSQWVCGRCRRRRIGTDDIGLVQPNGWTLCIACHAAMPGMSKGPCGAR
jgi:hypothetical protein